MLDKNSITFHSSTGVGLKTVRALAASSEKMGALAPILASSIYIYMYLFTYLFIHLFTYVIIYLFN